VGPGGPWSPLGPTGPGGPCITVDEGVVGVEVGVDVIGEADC
jgi:hypothetical protein